MTAYTYDTRGALRAVALPDGRTVEYVIDPLGRRIAKKINGVVQEKYLWQDMTRLLAVYDGSDVLKYRFQYAGGRMPVSVATEGTTYYLHYDQVGSLVALTATDGGILKRVTYDSFGNILSDTKPAFSVLGFAGGLYDADTGLVRFGYRDYDPETGRWTSKDPIGFDGGDTDLYGYCGWDPVNWVDADGLARKGNGGDGSASGVNTSTPYKHCRQHPTKPNKLLCKDKKSGKWKEVPKPSWWDSQNHSCSNNCLNLAQTAALLGAGYLAYKIGKIILFTSIGGPVGFGVAAITP